MYSHWHDQPFPQLVGLSAQANSVTHSGLLNSLNMSTRSCMFFSWQLYTWMPMASTRQSGQAARKRRYQSAGFLTLPSPQFRDGPTNVFTPWAAARASTCGQSSAAYSGSRFDCSSMLGSLKPNRISESGMFPRSGRPGCPHTMGTYCTPASLYAAASAPGHGLQS